MAGRQGKYVRVLYDYKYDSHGKNITIKEGDKCLLLKKTNSEWWSVIKHGEKKPIYVPANYVVELDDGKRGKSKGLRRHGGSVEDVADDEKSRSSSEDLLQNDDAFHNGSGSCDTSEHDSDSIRAKMTASDDSLDRIVDVDPEMEALDMAGAARSRVKNMVDKYEAPEYANLKTIRQAARDKKPKQEVEPEYANIPHLQSAPPAPPPTPTTAAEPIRQFAHDWEMYVDQETKRSYYHNTVSGESTWKPPRGLRAKDSSSPVPLKPPAPAVPEKPPPSPGRGIAKYSRSLQLRSAVGEERRAVMVRRRLKSFNSFGTAVVLGSTSDGDEDVPTEYIQVKGQSLPRLQKIPKGWSEEKTVDGVTTYHNQLTNEKYLSSVDDSGRVYYYKEDQSESTWVLPEIEQPPSASHHQQHHHQGRHERRSSVDSAIPEGVAASFKPRHSTILQHHAAATAAGDGLAAAFGNYPPAYRHSIAASPSALLAEDKRDDLRSPKLKQVDLPSVPDLPMSPKSPFSDLSSGPVSPEVLDSPISPTFSTSTPSESPCGSLKRHGQGEQRGMLNRTKVTEGGKKVKKNWCPSYVVVQGFTLYFYKDHKAAQPKPGSPSGRPDEVLDLHGATHELNNKDKTSRKNAIVVTLLSGTQWLLQADDAQKIQSWYGTLAHNLAQMPQMIVSRGSQESLNQSSDSLEQLDDDNSPPNASSRINRKKSRKEHKDKDKGATQLTDKEKTNTLDDPNLTLPEKQTKIKARLRNFFGQRPEKKTLQAKGIIKETVFGANLQHLSDREKTLIPRFIQQVAHTIEEKGLTVDGIYRVSGNLSQIMKLRHMVDHNEKYDFENPDWDIHVLTGALKLFFRELMEPLFPYKQFNMLLGGIKLHDRSGKLKVFKDAIKALPRPHRETIKFLFRHLNKVIEHSKENRMQTQNVAIVFGPTLMWPETETQNVAVTTVYQSQIVEFILLEYRNLF